LAAKGGVIGDIHTMLDRGRSKDGADADTAKSSAGGLVTMTTAPFGKRYHPTKKIFTSEYPFSESLLKRIFL
jgi:hypothetical protein